MNVKELISLHEHRMLLKAEMEVSKEKSGSIRMPVIRA